MGDKPGYRELLDFVQDIAAGSHENICPLEHPAYRNKWCACCEARKLLVRLELATRSDWKTAVLTDRPKPPAGEGEGDGD